jgi:hypothetical protein
MTIVMTCMVVSLPALNRTAAISTKTNRRLARGGHTQQNIQPEVYSDITSKN